MKRETLLEEEIVSYRLQNGLKVHLYHKPDYRKTYVSLKVKFGSIDKNFEIDDKEYNQPEGIAHFLEHKLFETKKGDAATLLAQLGASPNAYTSNTMTNYIFSATQNIPEALKILLDFVFDPCFNEESVAREREIIAQEIKMYADLPEHVLFGRLLINMYQGHSCRDDIGGTIESLKAIDVKALNLCHSSFYRPDNMSLMLTGNFPIKRVRKVIQNQQQDYPKPKSSLIRKYFKEPSAVNISKEVIQENVSIPKVGIGIKFKPASKKNQSLKREILIRMLFTLYLDESSPVYHDLLSKGFINDSFEMTFNFASTFAYGIINTDSVKPEKTLRKLQRTILDIKNFEINEKAFLRLKKSLIGQTIRILDSVEAITDRFLRYENSGYNFFEYRKILEAITIKDFDSIKKVVKRQSITTLLVMPNKV
ncbi:MAG: insulinase family protein [Erysipelotrichales bacterium]|nr:insulinase family protein [Erysipelotrichales bacterium]